MKPPMKPLHEWNKKDAWHYMALVAWARLRMQFHRRCNLTCDTKRRLYETILVPIGLIERLD